MATGVLTASLLGLALAVALLGLLIAAARLAREWRETRRAALAEPVRDLLFQLAGDDVEAAEALEALAALDGRHWAAIEPTVVSLLGKIRGEARASLIHLLERRGAASTALRDLRRRGAVRRARAATVLGSLGRRDAVAGLVALMSDRDPEVRAVATRALGRIGDSGAAAAMLERLVGPRPVPPDVVAFAVARLGTEARSALEEALGHGADLVRAISAEIIGLTGVVGMVPAVAQAVRTDSSVEVRVRAARALGRLGMPAGVDPLLDALDAREPAALRAEAARALGEVGATGATVPLRSLLADPAYEVAHGAAEALLRLGPAGHAVLAAASDGAASDGAAGQGAAAHATEVLAADAIEQARRGRRTDARLGATVTERAGP